MGSPASLADVCIYRWPAAAHQPVLTSAAVLHTGMGALHWAAAMGDEPCLAFLRERAMDVDGLSWAGLSPLAYAARGGHAGAVRLLLADANPSVGAL